ncbi:MAG TPA: hypothetical protein VFX49_22505, partial [Chloroflexota bacterium]|nr:hypothetical protein [Chloroflexota bacterium]
MSHDQRHFGRHSTVKAPAALLLALAVALSCVPALTTPVHAQEAAETPVAPHWIDLPAGKFFVGGDDALGLLGYAVVDETGGAPWWTSYTLLGGASALGVPVSRPFLLPDAHTYQAFEFGVLRWRPGLPLAEVAETLDLMWAAGRDEWLVSNGVPAMAAGPDHTHLARIGWLTHEPLRDAYFSAIHPTAESGLPAALLRFGLPAGPPASDATGTLQRFDRAALRWDAETAAVSVLPV